MSLELCKQQETNRMSKKLLLGSVEASKRRVSPRTLNKCQTERALKAKIVSKALFGSSNKRELKEDVKGTTNDCQQKAADKWDFHFDADKPARKVRNYKWVAEHPCDIPTFYKEISVKRSVCPRDNFEGQLPKLRYFHPKAQEENKNDINSLETAERVVAGRKGSGQTKITDFLKEKKRLSTTAISSMKRKLRSSSSQNRV